MLLSKASIEGQLLVESKQLNYKAEENVEISYFLDHSIEIHCIFSFNSHSFHFRFYYPASFLNKFQHNFERPFSLAKQMHIKHGMNSEVCCSLKDIFYQLATNNFKGVYQKLFWESQALMILLHSHKACERNTEEETCFNCKFLNIPSEKQKIMQARVILMINLSEPPTIPQLARTVHINECYLKKGFKEMYQMSIYDFVQQERITKAKQMLRQNFHSIQDIALELGYSNNSNFTNAFKKWTGFAPSEWAREHSI